ncbi:MAG: autotransporter-associated beta strand repeat-containing protein, partial [Sphaerospermopsis kisseleviana]
VGALTLAGSNSFNGATTVSAGTLRLANSYVLGAANGLTNTVSSGAAVELHGGIVVNDEILSLNGRGVNDDGALRNISGNNAFNGTILLNSTNRINSDAGTLTIGAVITNTTGKALSSSRSLLVGGAGNIVMMGGLDGTGTGGLIKDGAGTLTLNAASTYNGPTAVSAGTLEVKQANGVPANASTLTVSSGARLKADTNLSVGAMTLAGTLQMALGSTISSGGSVDVSGATIALTGAPSASSYILVTGTAITATNALLLSPAISGYSLVISGNTLALQQDSSGGFTAWASGYNLSGTNAGQTADPDLDGFINNLEYAFGGNPTVGTPALLTSSSSGSTIACSFIASTNSAAVSYVVESTTDLVAGPWSSNSLTQSITNSADTNNILLYPAYVRRGFSAAATNASGKIFYRIKSIISQ